MNENKVTTTTPTIKSPRIRPHPRIIENFVVIWLDQHIDESIDDVETQETVDRLRTVVNAVNTFNDVDRCIDFLSDIKEEKVFMIVSGSLGQQIISYIHDIAQLHSIYIFCCSQLKHEQWTKDWSKIQGVFTQIAPICHSLRETAQKCEQNFIPVSFVTASEVSEQNLDQLDQSFMYTQILKEILFEIKYTEQTIRDLVNYCREKYAGNDTELAIIDGFEKTYPRHSPIWWYTYQCFLHLMLNRALRTHEVDTIIRLGFFIQDLHRQIEGLHREQTENQQKRIFTVYRGQGLSKIEFTKMIKAQGGLMSFNNFLSTSKKRKISLDYAEDALNNLDMVGILFKMTIDPASLSTPFALIDGLSYYAAEQEILFSMHTVFRIGDIKPIENKTRLYQVELKLTNIRNQQIIALIERMREETRGSTGWHRLGMFLIKLGKFDKAEHVYRALFDVTSDETEKALLYHQFGLIKRNQGDYKEALTSYGKTLEVCQKIYSEDHEDLATVYNNIGQVYNSTGDYVKALEYYQKSLAIYQKTLDPNHLSVAISYNNIGLVLKFLGDYSKALESHHKALAIEQKTLPANHPSLATSYNNIGLVYQNIGEYGKALESHEKALEIEQKSLPTTHPSLAISYNNMGLLYDHIGEYSKALAFYEKTLVIYQKNLLSNHPHLAIAYNNIGSVYKNIGEYAKALLFYEKTLEIEKEMLPASHPDLAISYSNIGTIYENMDEYTKAREFHEQALQILLQIHPNEHRMLATFYNNLGSVYDAMGNYAEALVYYEKTLEIERETLPANHPDLATSYNNIGLIYINKEDFNTALHYLTKALDVYGKTLPPHHPNLAHSYTNIASVHMKLKEYSRALFYYEKALEIRQKSLPSHHPDLAISFSNLWQLYQAMGDSVKAYTTYQQSLEIHEKTLLSSQSNAIQTYEAIDQVFTKKKELSATKKSSLVRPIINKERFLQTGRKPPTKYFRMHLERRSKKK